MFYCYILNLYIYVPLFNSLYSSMVERNTVNILINVRFILKACIIEDSLCLLFCSLNGFQELFALGLILYVLTFLIYNDT